MEARARASHAQFANLLEFMERQGDLAKPQPGAQARLRADQLWEHLAKILNSTSGGVRKTSDKWKKVWADWKSKTKKKALTIRRRQASGGEGLNSRLTGLTLTDFEERLLTVIGTSRVDSPAEIEEQGYDIPSQSMHVDHFMHVDVDIKPVDVLKPPSPSSPLPSPDPLLSSTRQQVPPTARTSPRLPALTAPASFSTSTNRELPRTSSYLPSSRRLPLKARGRRGFTSFDRSASEYLAIEQRRLRLDEMRERNEARRIEVEHEHNDLLRRLADIAETLLQHYIYRNTVHHDTDNDINE